MMPPLSLPLPPRPFQHHGELHVIVCPISTDDPATLSTLLPLLTAHPRLPLPYVRPHYHAQDKSPFPDIPWSSGHITLRYVDPSPPPSESPPLRHQLAADAV